MTTRTCIDPTELTAPWHASHETLAWWGPIEARAAAEIRPVWASRWDGEPYGYADVVLLIPSDREAESLVVMTRDGADPDIVAFGDLRSAGHGDVADMLAKEVVGIG